jgi:hypothetical protein
MWGRACAAISLRVPGPAACMIWPRVAGSRRRRFRQRWDASLGTGRRAGAKDHRHEEVFEVLTSRSKRRRVRNQGGEVARRTPSKREGIRHSARPVSMISQDRLRNSNPAHRDAHYRVAASFVLWPAARAVDPAGGPRTDVRRRASPVPRRVSVPVRGSRFALVGGESHLLAVGQVLVARACASVAPVGSRPRARASRLDSAPPAPISRPIQLDGSPRRCSV